ncbi:MAG: ATP-binding cassette domain-containing protein [Saprospiraceae bacterium]|nr:ATP-binding cassette domain-containing protein [Saprospiraceae bacterium]MBK7524882.1 ATP-binding cassette domain-containing protein [Saprospiraceae bacterium]MBK8370182.1 ATP-binding cassette domain-containing protein [Saprospiraceae bacterium]MBK8546804.1 ATP-binding cassette domain-containing protein [Saprospiraceae bacterium]MBK8817931.1 ATP-binding cassette domain-containing protein [Saprospiraceae bacterium]
MRKIIQLDNNDSKKKFEFSKDNVKRVLQVFKYIKPYWVEFVIAMILLVLGSLIFMVLMGLPGEMTNTAIGQPKFKFGLSVNDYGWIFLVVLIVQGVFSYFRTVLFSVVSEKGMANIRKDLYNKIITQPIVFFEERRIGELTSRITTDIEQLQNVFSVTLAEFIRQVVVIVSGVAIIVYWTPSLSLIMLFTFPLVVVVAMIFGRYIRSISKKRQDQLATTNTIVEETFQSFSMVKSFVNEYYESVRYASSVDDVVKISLRFAKLRGVFFVFIITILFGAIFFILWRGALMVENKEMESGDLFSFIIYTTILGGAIASFGTLYTQILSALGATERILEILDRDSEIQISESKNEAAQSISGKVEFKNVSFSYPTRNDVEVLKNISITVLSGQKIALVGQSGGGKSTIVQLLLRFYNTGGGSIYIDDIPLENIPLYSLRKEIGIVPQDVILFGGSILENIRYGKTDADFEEIKEAARLSNSLEFIESFPDKFDTVVGERGIKLSGGQRQRIAIARAILKNPRILILDEATSSLDAESEKLVQDALENLMVGRTSIIIAHRLATIKDVDCIYVLEKGEILESGTHNQLINNPDGLYAQYARLQFQNNNIILQNN